MTDRFERFSYAMSEIYRNWHKLATKEMEKYNLKGIHSIYLLTMSNYPEGITASQLSEYSGRDKADVSRMLSILKKNGFICRQNSQSSLYRSLFKLTEKGQEAAAFARSRANLAVELAGKEMTEEERAIFYRCLESIMGNMKKLSKSGLPEE